MEEIEIEEAEKKTMAEKKQRRRSEPFLSEDLILSEILPRVPLKSLFRFKPVCKKWCSLISSDPIFITQQSQHCLRSSSTILYQGIKTLVFISPAVGVPDPSLSSLGSNPQLLASTNGLLCCFLYQGFDMLLYVFNPVTKDGEYVSNPKLRNKVGLAFDPSIDTSSYKLACPYLTNSRCIYDHCCSSCNGNCLTYGFEVFSSKTGVWSLSKAKLFVFEQELLFDKRSVFTGGKLYWKVTHDIVWFDLKEDRTGIVRFVGEKKVWGTRTEIGEYDGGGLSYIRITDTEIEIWVLREDEYYEFEFVKKYCMRLEGIFENNWMVMAPFFHTMKLRSRNASDVLVCRHEARPLPFEGGDEVLIWVKGKIFSYNMKSGKLKLIHRSEQQERWCPHSSYKNSLVPLPRVTRT